MGRRNWQGEVRIHDDSASGMGAGYPAVNVKMWGHKFPEGYELAAYFDTSEREGQELAEAAWDAQARFFWENVGDLVKEHLKTDDWSSAGRSGGWLEVHGLGDASDVREWDKEQVERWMAFEQAVQGFIDDLCKLENVVELIEANEWLEKAGE